VWSGHDSNRRRLQHEAFAKLQRVGAVFGWDGIDKFYGVNLRGRDAGDQELALVAVFNDDHFQHVDVSRTRLTDAGLRHLSGLKGLEILDLRDTWTGDDGLKHIAGLARLKVLHLSGTQVTDDGLADLERMQNLQWLSLSRTAVTDAAVDHLRCLHKLKRLDLYNTDMTEDGIAELRLALPELNINLLD
jgi:Leucine-rich repeat (LRR) protein